MGRARDNLKKRNSTNLQEELDELHATNSYFVKRRYNLRNSGMADHFRIIFNHEWPCVMYLACMFHYGVSLGSLRTQVWHTYVYDVTGLYSYISFANTDGCSERST